MWIVVCNFQPFLRFFIFYLVVFFYRVLYCLLKLVTVVVIQKKKVSYPFPYFFILHKSEKKFFYWMFGFWTCRIDSDLFGFLNVELIRPSELILLEATISSFWF
jgi:hypothetical protein